ncbi:MAG TPA: hypothetical protein VM432_02725 [Bdellovibrionales bacterium]|nr:hypothetical protein [Bdellovibrionales bacterium]
MLKFIMVSFVMAFTGSLAQAQSCYGCTGDRSDRSSLTWRCDDGNLYSTSATYGARSMPVFGQCPAPAGGGTSSGVYHQSGIRIICENNQPNTLKQSIDIDEAIGMAVYLGLDEALHAKKVAFHGLKSVESQWPGVSIYVGDAVGSLGSNKAEGFSGKVTVRFWSNRSGADINYTRYGKTATIQFTNCR